MLYNDMAERDIANKIEEVGQRRIREEEPSRYYRPHPHRLHPVRN
jgi:hypothetical protein